MSNASTLRAWACLILALAFAASPLVSGSFGGFDPNAFPVPQVNPPVQPEGYAFSIWGLIYLWLILGTGYCAFKRAEDDVIDVARSPLIICLGVGAAWIPIAQLSPLSATALIWVMAISAIMAFLRAPRDQDRWVWRAPIAVLAGWLTAAACVSLGIVGAGYGLGLDPLVWAYVSLFIALSLAAAILRIASPAPEYAAPASWALIGIAVANATVHPGLTALAVFGAIALVALSLRPRAT